MLNRSAVTEISLAMSRDLAIVTVIAAPISTAISSVASIGLLVTWLASGQVLHSLINSWRHPLGKSIVLFVVWLVAGTFYADTSLSAEINTLLSWKKLFFTFLLIGLFNRLNWQNRFVYAFAGFMVIPAVIAIPLWALGLAVRPDCEPGIIMTNHSTQSMGFLAALLCCIYLAHQPLTIRQKSYLWAAIFLFLFNIFFVSPARSGYLALPPAVAFAAIHLYGHKKLPQIIAVLGGIAIAAILSSTTLQQRFKAGLDEQKNFQTSSNITSVGIRMVFYENTWALIKARPIFGYGTSSFEKTYSALASEKYLDWRGGKSTDPHNQYLFVWLENGAVGLILFFAYIYTGIREGLQNPPYGPIAAAFLVAICFSSLFNSHFKTYAEGNLLAFFLGALLARCDRESSYTNQNA